MRPAGVKSEGEFRSAGTESPPASPKRGAFFIYFVFTSLFFLFFCHLFSPFFTFSSSHSTLIFIFFSFLTPAFQFFWDFAGEDVFQGVIAFHWAKIRYSRHKCHWLLTQPQATPWRNAEDFLSRAVSYTNKAKSPLLTLPCLVCSGDAAVFPAVVNLVQLHPC